MFTHLKFALMLNPVQGSEPCPIALKGMLDFVVLSDLHQGVLRFKSFKFPEEGAKSSSSGNAGNAART